MHGLLTNGQNNKHLKKKKKTFVCTLTAHSSNASYLLKSVEIKSNCLMYTRGSLVSHRLKQRECGKRSIIVYSTKDILKPPIKMEKGHHFTVWYHHEKAKEVTRELFEESRKNITNKHAKGKRYKPISKQSDVPVTSVANIIKKFKVMGLYPSCIWHRVS